MNQFLSDVLKGLTASPKYLESKYFYNEQGDQLFEDLMDCPEYYLTNCEREIFSEQGDAIARCILEKHPAFDLVELGAGDASKSLHLFEKLLNRKADFTYYPIDISLNVISSLEAKLPKQLPGLAVHGLAGEYLEMLGSRVLASSRPKLVLFLGSNIGNFLPELTNEFCRRLRKQLNKGDMVLSGFDLKKDPAIILNAYNDKGGITRQFNLNLLLRINNELCGNFDTQKFIHFPVYDPQTGSCKSYLVSSEDQTVKIGDDQLIHFDRYESIFMEISQKYTSAQVEQIALSSGFKPVKHFYDAKKWFVDSLWECV